MSGDQTGRLNLHEALRSMTYDHAVISTYTFDPHFFEDYCLEKFSSLSNNGNITVIIDQGTYEKAILGPESFRPKQANIRYLLHPISVPGRFHPKLFIFASKKRGRLILGSANFTKPGITSNAELVSCYDYKPENDESFQALFQTAFAFILEICERWPSEALTSNLQAMSRDAQWLVRANDLPRDSNAKLIHNLDSPLWTQVTSEIAAPVDAIYILSRYFDSNPALLNRLQGDLNPKKIKIFTQNGITTLTEDWLRHPSVKDGTTEILLCEYKDDESYQPLHAKAIAIEKSDRCVLAFGSANFTSPAMFNAADKGNVEVLLLINGLKGRDIEPERLFDPHNNASLLRDDGILVSSPHEEDFGRSEHELTLFEATLIGDKIWVRAEIPYTVPYDILHAILIFQNEGHKALVIIHEDEDKYHTTTSQDIVQRIGQSSSILRIEALKGDEVVATSNSILVTNLMDIRTGHSVRRERHIKEAEQSVIQFFGVLNSIIEDGDESELIRFLTLCSIEVSDAARPVFVRGMKNVWDGGSGMKKFGERNLILFADLNEAVVDFCNRHLRKLQRHVEYGGLNGIANFMHIFLAVGGVIRAQLERALRGFESKMEPMSPSEWSTYRKHFEQYLTTFEQLLRCLWEDYLRYMLNEYELEEIRQRFAPDLQTLHDLCSDMLDFRDRFELLRQFKLKVKTDGQTVIPGYFACILNERRWPMFTNEVRIMLTRVEQALIGE